MPSLHKSFKWCLDLVFPRSCLGCGKDGSYLCPDCFESLPVTANANCPFCGRRSPTGYACQSCRHRHYSLLSGILVASDWNNLLLRQIIYEYKYRFVKELSAPLSELMINFLERIDFVKMLKCSNVEMIFIPVPLHKKRFAWRGFNQSELLARQVGEKLNAEPSNDILIRSRRTLPQREIAGKKARTANIKNAFALSEKYSRFLPSPDAAENPIKNKIVILVDDVCTTGSTLQDCARALKPLKPKEIWCLVVARG